MKLYYLRDYYVMYLEEASYQWAVLANTPQEALDCLCKKDTPLAMMYFKEPWNFENYKLNNKINEGPLTNFTTHACYVQLNKEIKLIFSITELGELITGISINKPRILI